jgi:hypothetical protein
MGKARKQDSDSDNFHNIPGKSAWYHEFTP